MSWETNNITGYRHSFGTKGSPTITLFSGTRLVGWLTFRDNPPKPKKDGKRYKVYLERDLHASAVDMLRNERPVFLQFFKHNDPQRVHAHLATSKEPTGEEES